MARIYKVKDDYFSDNKIALMYYAMNNFIIDDIKIIIMKYYLDIYQDIKFTNCKPRKYDKDNSQELVFETEIMSFSDGIHINVFKSCEYTIDGNILAVRNCSHIIELNNIENYYLKYFYKQIYENVDKLAFKGDAFNDFPLNNYLIVHLTPYWYIGEQTIINYSDRIQKITNMCNKKIRDDLKQVKKAKLTIFAELHFKKNANVNVIFYFKEITIVE